MDDWPTVGAVRRRLDAGRHTALDAAIGAAQAALTTHVLVVQCGRLHEGYIQNSVVHDPVQMTLNNVGKPAYVAALRSAQRCVHGAVEKRRGCGFTGP